MKITALLTGRGNNTLKDKNILDILGKPVLYYPAKAARKSELINDFYCSSDDKNILEISNTLGFKSIIRPARLATPNSQHIECILHALEVMESDGGVPDILVVLLANNVTIRSEWITDCVKIMMDNMNVSAIVPVYQDNDHHPLRAKVINEDGKLGMYVKTDGEVSTNRQELPKCFFLAHNFWVLNVQQVLSNEGGQPPWSFMGNNIYPYIIKESIDIHDKIDLYIAKEWIKEHYTD